MFLIGHFLLVSTGQSKSPDWAWNQWDREVQFTQKRASNKYACILNGPLAGYKILGWHCFYHSILKWSFHCLLPSTVDEKFILSLMFFFKSNFPFFLVVLKIVSLLLLCISTMIDLNFFSWSILEWCIFFHQIWKLLSY